MGRESLGGWGSFGTGHEGMPVDPDWTVDGDPSANVAGEATTEDPEE